MIGFIAKRLLAGLTLLIAVSVGTFFLAHLAVSDPTVGLLGTMATPAQRVALTLKLGLDRPLLVQFWVWVSHAAVGDLGLSWRNSQPVNALVAMRLPVTLSVVAASTLLTAAVGISLGLIAGLRPGSVFDRVVKGASVILFALPGFWVALMLVIIFAIQLNWFPAVGYVPFTISPSGWLRSITLPAVSLSLGTIVIVAEQLRNEVISVANQEFVRTLRSRGLSPFEVGVHILRNASPVALTALAVLFVSLLSGAVVVEAIFNLPGIGQLTNASSQIGDIPVMLGITVVSVVFVVAVNFLLDVMLGWLNPKARLK